MLFNLSPLYIGGSLFPPITKIFIEEMVYENV